MRQSGDKVVTAEQRYSQKGPKDDPRLTVCPVNQYGRHRWARSHRDTVSKTSYLQMLRCRYCAHYVGIQFQRVVLPSGAVMINEAVREVHAADIGAEVTVGSRLSALCDVCKKRIDSDERIQVASNGHPLIEGEDATQQHSGQGKAVTKG